MSTDYQVRIVTDDDRCDQIGEAIPLYIPWRLTQHAHQDELFTAAAAILQGHVQRDKRDLRCIIEQWRVGEAEFQVGFTMQTTGWQFVGTTTVKAVELGEGVAWDR